MSSDLGPTMDRPTETNRVEAHPRPPKSDIPHDEMIRKCTPWNGRPLRPDPFRSGHPNPLAYHPVLHTNDVHIIHPQNDKALVAVPDSPLHESIETKRLESFPCGERLAVRSLGPLLSRPNRVDSLFATDTATPDSIMSESVSSAQEINATSDTPKSLFTRIGMGKVFKGLLPVPKLESAKTSTISVLSTLKSSLDFHLPAQVYSTSTFDGSLQNFIAGDATETESKTEKLYRHFISLQNEIPASDLEEASRPITRGIDYDIPIKHSPASGLPKGWTRNHDRLIAYLDTHAKLNEHGLVPESLEDQERYELSDMAAMLQEICEVFKHTEISHTALRRRLSILELQSNNFFNIPYFWYQDQPWGRKI